MMKLDFDKDRLKTAFKVLDLDQDGYITAEELTHALNHSGGHFTEEEIRDIIKKADKNMDGKIDYNGKCFIYNGYSALPVLGSSSSSSSAPAD